MARLLKDLGRDVVWSSAQGPAAIVVTVESGGQSEITDSQLDILQFLTDP